MDDYRTWKGGTFYETVTAAVNDMAEHGYDSEARLAFWLSQIGVAARDAFGGIQGLTDDLKSQLEKIYHRARSRSKDPKRHKGIPAYIPAKLTPDMRKEVDRRIASSANLIKLNREKSIATAKARFAGWGTSIPEGGSFDPKIMKTKGHIAKTIKQLPFEERRVIIDQGHKLAANLDDVIATKGGAIAVIWNSHFRELNYDYREIHKLRDGKIYALRDGWAVKEGLINKCEGFYEDSDAFGELPFCRCFGSYLYNLQDIPEKFLTAKGKEYIAKMKGAKTR